jgi:hypothetical protein
MNELRKASLTLLVFLAGGVLALAGPVSTPNSSDTAELGQLDVRFTQTAPYSDATNITRRFGYSVELPAYAITNESFRIIVPGTYSTNGSWGLLVWICPGDEPNIPPDWKEELKNQTLLFVSAHRSGNERHPLDRFRLALDGACNLCRRYKVDRKRIYIGGFSGGARMASMLGVAYADLFTGTLCVCGVNFYKDVPNSDGKYYSGTFAPDPGTLLLSKKIGRFVLLTGEHDQNRENTKTLWMSGFKRDGFRSALYLEVPGMGHAMPDVKIFKQSLEYLGGKSG